MEDLSLLQHAATLRRSGDRLDTPALELSGEAAATAQVAPSIARDHVAGRDESTALSKVEVVPPNEAAATAQGAPSIARDHVADKRRVHCLVEGGSRPAKRGGGNCPRS